MSNADLVSSIPAPAIVWRESGEVVAVNEAFCSLVDRRADAIVAAGYWGITAAGQKQREIGEARRLAPYAKEFVTSGGVSVTVRVVGITQGGTDHEYVAIVAGDAQGVASDPHAVLRRQNEILLRVARDPALDGGAGRALRLLTEAASDGIGVERASVWLYSESERSIVCEDLFERGDRKHSAGIELMASDFPKYFDALSEDRTIAADDAHTHPATAEFSESYLTPLGITSMLEAPIRRGGKLVGVLCSEHVGNARTFTQEEQLFAASLADFVARALDATDRRRAQEAADEARAGLEAQQERLEQVVRERTAELEERQRENAQLIQRLRAAVNELSTPVVELWDDVLALPLVGVIDTQRSVQMTERLLVAVTEKQARFVIVDLTGVELVDTSTADRILQLARAVELLGAECIMTGLQPAVAQTLVELGVDFSGLSAKRNLKQALRYCTSRASGGAGRVRTLIRRNEPRALNGSGAPLSEDHRVPH